VSSPDHAGPGGFGVVGPLSGTLLISMFLAASEYGGRRETDWVGFPELSVAAPRLFS